MVALRLQHPEILTGLTWPLKFQIFVEKVCFKKNNHFKKLISKKNSAGLLLGQKSELCHFKKLNSKRGSFCKLQFYPPFLNANKCYAYASNDFKSAIIFFCKSLSKQQFGKT